MKRGEVWWANLPKPIGRRPVLMLSRDSMPVGRPEITVAYITTNIRNLPVEVLLGGADGFRQPSAVNLDSINTIPKGVLDRRMCILSAARMAQVRDAAIEALALK